MPPVTIHNAKTNLSKLIEQAMNGEDVVIAKGAKPVVQGGFKVGILKDHLGQPPDFVQPMEAEELNRWEAGN